MEMHRYMVKTIDLICDEPGCNYSENVDLPINKKHIGKTCPNCGENLLTQEDFDAAYAMFAAIDAQNAATEAAAQVYKERGIPVVTVSSDLISINPHDGQIKIKKMEE